MNVVEEHVERLDLDGRLGMEDAKFVLVIMSLNYIYAILSVDYH